MLEKIFIVGTAGKDATISTSQNGQSVARFSVVASRKRKVNGEYQEEKHWFQVSVWGIRAEAAAKFVKKGIKIAVTGHLAADPVTGGPRVYTKNDGTVSAGYDIYADDFECLTYASNQQNPQQSFANNRNFQTPPPVNTGAAMNNYGYMAEDEFTEDLPF